MSDELTLDELTAAARLLSSPRVMRCLVGLHEPEGELVVENRGEILSTVMVGHFSDGAKVMQICKHCRGVYVAAR